MTLKLLRIQNIILIEHAEIAFENGFNVLSGETGSGKSAIMGALNLIMGERADTGMIRRGEEKGTVEAEFDLDNLPLLQEVLEAAGIDHERGESLLLRREISLSGKGRAFINNQLAQLTLLKRVGEHLLDIVGQHANQRLLSLEHHREWVDLYGSHEADVATFSASWHEENTVRGQLEELVQNEAQRLRELEVCRRELSELEEANLKEGEEEELFSEYTLLANADERAQKVNDILQVCSGSLPPLNRNRTSFDAVVHIDPSLAEIAALYQTALVELQEVSYSLSKYLGAIEANPERMTLVEERLSCINKLKKKYGQTFLEIQNYRAEIQSRLQRLENADIAIEDLKQRLQALELKNSQLAEGLTKKRKVAARGLAQALVEQLQALNMPKVQCEVEVTTQKRSRTGDDKIEFFLVPNVGERRVPVRDCASGGELSRVMLALQTLMAGKEKIPTVVFDEIDANIGGATATVIGEKMREIGRNHQVLCITHFPQVAKHADHHVQISKREREGRTFTEAHVLSKAERESELTRMLGGT